MGGGDRWGYASWDRNIVTGDRVSGNDWRAQTSSRNIHEERLQFRRLVGERGSELRTIRSVVGRLALLLYFEFGLISLEPGKWWVSTLCSDCCSLLSNPGAGSPHSQYVREDGDDKDTDYTAKLYRQPCPRLVYSRRRQQ